MLCQFHAAWVGSSLRSSGIQGGYFTTADAAHAGVSSRLLTYYTNAGDIDRVPRGVYRLSRFPMHRFGGCDRGDAVGGSRQRRQP